MLNLLCLPAIVLVYYYKKTPNATAKGSLLALLGSGVLVAAVPVSYTHLDVYKRQQLEGSKEFAKGFMMRHQIPTARYKSITAENLEEGLAFLETLEAPYVLKADGLCAGKGVLILPTLDEAKKELKEMLGGMFGSASATVVIEEFLSGIECSVFVLTDGEHYKVLPVAKDYKRIGRCV